MSRITIEKTSNEEGKYGEIITNLFYNNYKELGGTNKRFMDITLVNQTKNRDYQKIDCDFQDEKSNILIEVKHDTWIAGKKDKYKNGTGNLTYEVATHLSFELCDKIKTFISKYEKISLNEILKEFPELLQRFVGCNEKCKANQIFLVGGEEEKMENKKYILKKIWAIRNFPLQKYAHSVNAFTEKNMGNVWLRFPFHHEDNCFNMLIIIPVNFLVDMDIAHEMPQFMFDKLINKYPMLTEYHTSDEIENLCG